VDQVMAQSGSGAVYNVLMKKRTLVLSCDMDEYIISELIASLLVLEKEDETAPVNLIIMSWGGSLADGLGLYDVMKSLSCPINTYAIGKACSAGALVLAAGTGLRAAYPSTRIMIHQPSGGTHLGTVSDTRIAQDNDLSWKKLFLEALAESTGQTFKRISRDCERDKWMSATEAVEYGLVDEVVVAHRRKPLVK
jgi:ATP-dependent Clp protease protease subunit